LYSYGLEGWGSIPDRGKIFFFLHSVKTGSEAHPAYCSVGTGVVFPGVKWPVREADHSRPSGVEVTLNGVVFN
jgi:hypothetical protein